MVLFPDPGTPCMMYRRRGSTTLEICSFYIKDGEEATLLPSSFCALIDEMHHKRGRPKNRRSGCLCCKPWKVNGADRRTLNERRADQDNRETFNGYYGGGDNRIGSHVCR